MKILKRYADENTWHETTEDECLEHTERAGYWKDGTVLSMLEEGHTVFTPFARYKKESAITLPEFVIMGQIAILEEELNERNQTKEVKKETELTLSEFVRDHCAGREYDSCVESPCVYASHSGCKHPLHPNNTQKA